jgi:hypothetical protein
VTSRATLTRNLTIIMFVMMIGAPLVGWIAGVSNDPAVTMFEEHPNRTWSWSPRGIFDYARRTQRDANTDFPFRDRLIELHAHLKLRLFGVSSASTVTLGNDGWLFYAGEKIIADFQRVRPFTEAELEEWTQLLSSRKHWLAERGIPFLFYIAPNPQTLYPEHMPAHMWRAANPSRMDQLIEHLRTHSDVDVLDLRPALLAAKQSTTVVYKTDSHWNQRGGFIAYQEIGAWMKHHFPAWRTFTLADFDEVQESGWHGGLAYFLGAPDLFGETRVELRPRRPGVVTSDGLPQPSGELFDAWFRRPRVVRESYDGEIPSALVLRDSQFAAPGQFLSRHFRRSTLLWTAILPVDVVLAEHPSVVIFGIAERLLMNPVPRDPPLP